MSSANVTLGTSTVLPTHKVRHRTNRGRQKQQQQQQQASSSSSGDRKQRKQQQQQSLPASPATLHILQEMIDDGQNRTAASVSGLNRSWTVGSSSSITEVPVTNRPIIMIYPTSKTVDQRFLHLKLLYSMSHAQLFFFQKFLWYPEPTIIFE